MEMDDLESQEEDVPKCVLFFKPKKMGGKKGAVLPIFFIFFSEKKSQS